MNKLFISLFRIVVITSCLVGLVENSQAFQSNPVFLNHFYRVVDSVTYRDIVASEFLRNEFSTGDLRTTTTSTGDSWSGIYLYGEKNYIEFFDENFRPVSVTGIGFGVETQGAIEKVTERLEAKFRTTPESELVDRNFNGKYIPWFYSTGIAPNYDGKTNLITWVMEYHPDFLEGWFPSVSDALGISRQAILTHYKAKLLGTKSPPSTYFKNVSLLEIKLERQYLKRLLDELEAFDFDIQKKGKRYVCRGPEITFDLSEGLGKDIGVQRIELTLNMKKTGSTEYRFGPKSVLRFHNDLTATWTF